jgi:hypothetical protein
MQGEDGVTQLTQDVSVMIQGAQESEFSTEAAE